MKNKLTYFTALCLLFSLNALAQEQFEKRFSISFVNEPFRDAIMKLTKTQSHGMAVSWGSNLIYEKSLPVTANLHNVTFDEAMDSILAKQNICKDYWILDYGGDKKTMVLHLEERKIANSRYVERNKNKGRYYHVGDILPDSSYAITNYHGKTNIKLADIKKKLLILDMWNINCAGCIEAMPELEKLQEKFGNQVQIIMVTRDSREQVELLKKHVKIVRETKLPFITGENVLGSLFEYDQVPTQVWIDESGFVKYITKTPIASERHIRDFLSGKRMDIRDTKDTVLSLSYARPLAIALEPIQRGDFGISSFLVPHKSEKYFYGVYLGGFSDTDRIKGVIMLRLDINTLYREAYFGHTFSKTPVIKEYNHPEKYERDTLSMSNFYDYELAVKRKETTAKQFYHLMQQELDTYFNIQSTLEKRKIDCYVITRIGKIDRLKGVGKTDNYPVMVNNILTVNNVSWGEVLNKIYDLSSNVHTPFIDETGIDHKMGVNFKINTDFDNSKEEIRKSLASYGLAINKIQREVQCIILKNVQ
ncbi:TlpA family protein disulfide reductase [Mucilaginibacter flavidus]|uniref:TlpA family protein disulfide reductase n=1 Tax=Mucilaginibacter flavidus TaxID=2949309 RepID=UPI002092EF98|nr:redoxin domain-containing protein [Mucilaginibacter flavidus]MCO5947932.1 redoxin domain-containing protein [Mucilaginibacter flavidus]